MKVTIKSKYTKQKIEYKNVTGITYSDNTFTIEHDGIKSTFSNNDFYIAVMIM